MKIGTLVTLFLSGIIVFAADLYLSRWEYMSAPQAGQKWGHQIFKPEEFRKATVSQRGAMTESLINSKFGIGKTKAEIKAQLGDDSGFFWNDSIPVYIVHERQNPEDSIWQVVFLPDRNGKIAEVRIQNNKPPRFP